LWSGFEDWIDTERQVGMTIEVLLQSGVQQNTMFLGRFLKSVAGWTLLFDESLFGRRRTHHGSLVSIHRGPGGNSPWKPGRPGAEKKRMAPPR
jgi:hypothetical protein